MPKSLTFAVTALWDEEAGVWSGYCDAIPAAADAPTHEELAAKIREMAIDVLQDNRPDVDADQIRLVISN